MSSFSDRLTLLQIWANQRGYSEGTQTCVRGFEGGHQSLLCGEGGKDPLELVKGEQSVKV